MRVKPNDPRFPFGLGLTLAGLLLVACSASAPNPPPSETPAPEPPALAHPELRGTETEPSLPWAPGPRGMWVLAEGSQQVLEDPARVGPLLETAEELEVTPNVGFLQPPKSSAHGTRRIFNGMEGDESFTLSARLLGFCGVRAVATCTKLEPKWLHG